MKLLVFLVLLVTPLASSLSLAKSPPPGTGSADVPANILFMVDTSGSMGWPRPVSSQQSAASDDIAIDSNGYIYAVSASGNNLSKYDSGGQLIWRVGSSGAVRLGYPYNLSIDNNDHVYVADYLYRSVKVFSVDGQLIKQWTIPDYTNPVSIAAGDSFLYVGARNGYVYKFSKQGQLISKQRISYLNDISVFGDRLYAVDTNSIYSCDLNLSCNRIYNRTTNKGIVASKYGVVVNKYSYSQFYRVGSRGGLTLDRTYSSSAWRYAKGLGVDSNGNIYTSHSGSTNYEGINKWSFNSSIFLSNILRRPPAENLLTQVKRVIKRIVSDSELTSGANFGLINWDSRGTAGNQLNIPISEYGASSIFSKIDSLRAPGGTYPNDALQWVKRNFESYNSPINKNISCQKTFIILLSDGSFSDGVSSSYTAKLLLDQLGVKTFVVGFKIGSQPAYKRLAEAGGTDEPLYADSWQQLYSSLTDAIRQAITSNLSFTSPMIMPAQSGGQDHLIQPQFTYKSSNQWEGHLKKYKLNADGSLGSVVWDAGEKLNKKRESTRNIWSPLKWVGVGDSLNNFTTGNLQRLKSALYANAGYTPTDTEASLLIQHTRGLDSYDEDGDGSRTDDRWKLGDIYHGVPSVVGKPQFRTTSDKAFEKTEGYYRYHNGYDTFAKQYQSRKEIVYAPSNDGMLHAFDSITGEEKWAFIPPNVIPKLREKITSKPNSSNAIYAVDGSPTVKDIYYGGKWRTVLLGGLGRGGHGYYSLDITDPDKPEFLYAFSNYPTEQMVRYIDASGNLRQFNYSNVPAELDFRKLGEAWSTPQITLIPYGGKMKWVAVFGGGYNGSTNPNYGSSVFVIDLETGGQILKRIDLTDKAGGVANSVPSDISLVNADSTKLADYKGALLYVTDLESKLWKINLTDQGTLFDLTQIFDGEGSNSNARLSFFAPALSIDSSGDLWAYFGTGDQQRLQQIDPSISNRIFGIRDSNFPKFSSVSSKTAGALKDTTATGSACPTDAYLGWFNKLKTNEKVTGKIAVSNETVFVSRYIPNNLSLCSPGKGSLSEHDFVCGGIYSGGSHELGAGIPTGAVIYKNRIYVGSSSMSSDGLAAGWKKTDNIAVGTSVKSTAGKGTVKIESWRERF